MRPYCAGDAELGALAERARRSNSLHLTRLGDLVLAAGAKDLELELMTPFLLLAFRAVRRSAVPAGDDRA